MSMGRALRGLSRRLSEFRQSQNDRSAHTYQTQRKVIPGSLQQYTAGLDIAKLQGHFTQIVATTDLFLQHHFDLLGSGWIKMAYQMRCRGVEGCRYDMAKHVKVDRAGDWLEDL